MTDQPLRWRVRLYVLLGCLGALWAAGYAWGVVYPTLEEIVPEIEGQSFSDAPEDWREGYRQESRRV